MSIRSANSERSRQPSIDGKSREPALEEMRRRGKGWLSREELRRDLLRANTAATVIVILVVALATGAIFLAIQSAQSAADAKSANARAREELWKSYLAQARAGRLSGVMGRREAGLTALAAAARIRPSLEVRNEAIAHLALTDLTLGGPPVEHTNFSGAVVDQSGTRAASYSVDRRLVIIDIASHAEVVNVRPSPSIRPINFSPDGKFISGTDSQGKLCNLDAETGEVYWRQGDWRAVDFAAMSGEDPARGVLSEDRDVTSLEEQRTSPARMAVAVVNRAGDRIRFLDPSTGMAVMPAVETPAGVEDICMNRTGALLALSRSNRVDVLRRRGEVFQLWRHFSEESGITAMTWGGELLAAGDRSGDIHICNTQDGRRYVLRGHKALISNLAFSHRGDLLVSVSYDGSSKLWNPWSGREVITTTLGFGLRFTESDQELVYRTRNALGVWRVARAAGYRELTVADSAAMLFHADFSESGEHLAVAKDDGIRVFHIPSGTVVAQRPVSRARSVHFISEGNALLTAGESQLSVWPLTYSGSASGEITLGQPRVLSLPATNHVETASLDARRRRAILPISHTSAAMIDLAHSFPMLLISNTPEPKISALSPDGQWAVTGTFHGGKGSRLWDARTGRHIRDLSADNASAFFSPRGDLMVLAGNREYQFFDPKTWSIVHRVPAEVAGDVPTAAAFSSDGSMVAIMLARTVIQLLNTTTFESIATLAPPENHILTWLAFDSRGEKLAAAATRDFVEIWDLKEIWRKLAEQGLQLTPDAVSIATGLNGPVPPLRGMPLSGWNVIFGLMALVAVVIAVGCALFVLSRQRRLWARYFQADTLVEQRNQELSLAQAEIMHGQKMTALGTLAAGIAHDFNNLLSVIRMANKLIARETTSNADVQDNAAEIEQAVKQGKTVVKSMLGYSKDPDDNDVLVPVPEVIEDAVGLLSRHFLTGIALHLELDPHVPKIRISRGRLDQILLNLIVNAAEAMDGKGSLRISVRQYAPAVAGGENQQHLSDPSAAASFVALKPAADADSCVEIVVADSGPGISADILNRIFEPFFTTKNVGVTRGTGLGLSMVHTMAEQEGIGIFLRTQPGCGTEFHLLLPIRP